MKRGKLLRVTVLLLWLMQLVAEGFVFATVWRLNMLPGLYQTALIGVLLLVWAMTGFLLFLPGGTVRRGFGCVMVLLVVLSCAAVVTVVSDVYQRLHAVVQTPADDHITRDVFVRADDPAQTLADAGNYTFGRVEAFDEEYIVRAIHAIEQDLGHSIGVQTYTTVRQMVDALYAGQIDAIVINSANIDMLEDDANYADVHQKLRLLCEITLEELPDVPTTLPDGETEVTNPEEPPQTVATLPEIETPEDITNTPFVMYIAGSDDRSGKLTKGRNDVNILAVVNPETKQILLLNTPRDYYIANPAGKGAKDKLTHCGNNGVENAMKSLEQLYGIPVGYYARINFEGFTTMIDAVGGITVYSEKAFTTVDGCHIRQGENHLDGAAALSFARERKALATGDSARGENQMKVITAMLRKLTSGTTIITKYADILDSLSGMLATNITMEEISQLVKMQLTDMASWNIVSYGVTGSGGSEITYSDPGHYLYVTYPNMKSVEKAQTLIRMVVEGEILSGTDVN